jgi:hypothetical protein
MWGVQVSLMNDSAFEHRKDVDGTYHVFCEICFRTTVSHLALEGPDGILAEGQAMCLTKVTSEYSLGCEIGRRPKERVKATRITPGHRTAMPILGALP